MPLLQTERLNTDTPPLDRVPHDDALELLLGGQVAAVESVRSALPRLREAAAAVAETLRAGDTLVYVAAGSSGLMALADAAELPGTFGIARGQIRICMAGGVPTDGTMPGDTEDETAGAAGIVESLSAADLVIALSASGSTPWPVEIARLARAKGCRILAIANNASTPLLGLADIAICLPTPAEPLAGSTRMGAGTAQKVALNMISTLAGVMLGHVHDGLMINLRPENAKLRNRLVRIVAQAAGTDASEAATLLAAADGDAKQAVLLAAGATSDVASEMLRRTGGVLRPALEEIASKNATTSIQGD